MTKCDECWCEHYDKNNGNCDKCLRQEPNSEKPEHRFIQKMIAVRQMELDETSKQKGNHVNSQGR